MSESSAPDMLVQRLHSLAVKHGLTIKEMTIKEMAQPCGVPKSSLEGYLRLKEPKRPGIDAVVSIAAAMNVSIDWLVGRSDSVEVAENERKKLQ